MNNTTTALLVKFVMTFVAAGIAFAFIDTNPLWWIFLVAVIATAVNYLVGDLIVLPSMGNIVASVGDGIMAAIAAWIVSFLTPGLAVSFTSLIVFAILIMIGEFFFHQYLGKSEEVEP